MGRPKMEFRTASRENYDRFMAEHPGSTLTFKQFKDIIYLWNEYFMTSILETGDKIKIPYGFGYLSINKKKTKRYFERGDEKFCILPVDWKATKAEGKKVYILNNHTDGYRFKWFWFIADAKFKLANLWRFKPARKFSTLLHTYLTKKKDKNYVDIYNEWYRGKEYKSNHI